jgi:hypothetical protein
MRCCYDCEVALAATNSKMHPAGIHPERAQNSIAWSLEMRRLHVHGLLQRMQYFSLRLLRGFSAKVMVLVNPAVFADSRMPFQSCRADAVLLC